jgi:DNA-binding MarR family transcriptional regulator
MEKRRYIVRKSSKTDRRVMTIPMTPKGGKMSLSAHGPIQDNLLFRLIQLFLKDVLKYHQALQKIA